METRKELSLNEALSLVRNGITRVRITDEFEVFEWE